MSVAGALPIEKSFEDFVRDSSFPCLGAKSALAKGQLLTFVARDITSAWNDVELYEAIARFVATYRNEKTLFRSFAVIFEKQLDLTEKAFELALWDRLQSLSDKDAAHFQRYDRRVSGDPDNPHFSLSFAGEAFFVVGMHPNASRPARRFTHPVLVFNLHDQFEQLRKDGRYEKLRSAILGRDLELAGSENPMLSRHGEKSEAQQYSGRAVNKDWACPFSPEQRKTHEPEGDFAAIRDRLSSLQRADADSD